MREVYVITGAHMGWDCLVGVIDADTIGEDELKEKIDKSLGHEYIVHTTRIQTADEFLSDMDD